MILRSQEASRNVMGINYGALCVIEPASVTRNRCYLCIIDTLKPSQRNEGVGTAMEALFLRAGSRVRVLAVNAISSGVTLMKIYT